MSNVTILQTSIRENNSLFSLNDLHIASGRESKRRPNQFLRLDQTKELIAEMENESQPRNTILIVKNGLGSYACEELALAYAMWISPKFHLVVLRAFLAMHKGEPKPQPQALPASTVDERTGLRNAVNMLVAKRKLTHSEVYGFIHQRFNVEKIEQLTAEQIQQAIEYIQRLAIDVDIEFPKQLPLAEVAADEEALRIIANLYCSLNGAYEMGQKIRKGYHYLRQEIDKTLGGHYIHNLNLPAKHALATAKEYIHGKSEYIMFIKGMASLLEQPQPKRLPNL